MDMGFWEFMWLWLQIKLFWAGISIVIAIPAMAFYFWATKNSAARKE